MELGEQLHWVEGVFRENTRMSKASEQVCSEFWSISIENIRGRMGKVMVIERKPRKAGRLHSDDLLETVLKDSLQRIQVHHLTTGIIILPTSWGWPQWSLFWLVGSWPGNLLTLLQSLLRKEWCSILVAWHVMYLLRSKIELSFHSFEQEGVAFSQWTSRNPFLVLPGKHRLGSKADSNLGLTLGTSKPDNVCPATCHFYPRRSQMHKFFFIAVSF